MMVVIIWIPEQRDLVSGGSFTSIRGNRRANDTTVKSSIYSFLGRSADEPVQRSKVIWAFVKRQAKEFNCPYVMKALFCAHESIFP